MFIIFLSFPFDNDFFKTKQAGLSSCLPLLRRCMQTLFLSMMAMSAAGTAGTAVAAASFAFFFCLCAVYRLRQRSLPQVPRPRAMFPCAALLSVYAVTSSFLVTFLLSL